MGVFSFCFRIQKNRPSRVRGPVGESDELGSLCSRFAWFRSVYVTDLAKPPSVSREGAPDIEHMHMQIRTAATLLVSVASKTAGEVRFSMFGGT
jgi:hypothetical protein